MRRLDDGQVEIQTCAEQVIMEIVNRMIDQGYHPSDTVILLRGAKLSQERLTPAPMLDETLTPEFVEWLTDVSDLGEVSWSESHDHPHVPDHIPEETS
jgi:hypothetical protein